ncbi:AtzE family amidohydrolase, partial [Pandoraea nosoerga]|uniref:amidase family protein n=1 Tax=Pandoraea nosoerga TaxID=2508296 RepID=UPI001F119F56
MKPDTALIPDMDWASASKIADAVSSRRMSAIDVINGALSRIAAHDSRLNSFTDVISARARATAGRVDATIAAGGKVGPLAGVPFAVKNLFDIEGLPTRAGSK